MQARILCLYRTLITKHKAKISVPLCRQMSVIDGAFAVSQQEIVADDICQCLKPRTAHAKERGMDLVAGMTRDQDLKTIYLVQDFFNIRYQQ
ncbi:hypothetical protein CHS0354_031456, partial [Potamilus streckersoni]